MVEATAGLAERAINSASVRSPELQRTHHASHLRGVPGNRGLKRLELSLDFVHCRLIEQLPKVNVPQNFFELRLIDRESLGPPLGERCIAFIDVIRDVGEQQSGSEGRRLFRGDGCNANLPVLDLLQNLCCRRKV